MHNMFTVKGFLREAELVVTFSEKLNTERKARGIPARLMAESIGIELRSYRNYESGDREPSLAVLVKIADILNISLDELLCRDGFISDK